MNKIELDMTIDELSGMMFGEMGKGMLEDSDEDVLKALKVMRAAKKMIIAQNNDIEELKSRLEDNQVTLNKILYEVSKINREKA